MQNAKNAKAANTNVQAANTNVQVVTDPVTVVAPVSLRAKRVQTVKQALLARYRQAKLVAHQVATATKLAYEQQQQQLAARQQYELEVAQVAAKYGFTPEQVLPRANSATVIPSTNQVLFEGQYYRPTKAVHAVAASMQGATRKQVIDACIALNVNKATAETQYGIWKSERAKQAAAAAAAAAPTDTLQ